MDKIYRIINLVKNHKKKTSSLIMMMLLVIYYRSVANILAKIICVVIPTLLTAIYPFGTGIVNYCGSSLWDRPSAAMASLVNSVTSMPYYERPYYRNADIKGLSREEWFSLPDYKNGELIKEVIDETELTDSIPTLKEAQHMYGLYGQAYSHSWKYIKKPKLQELCDDLFTCNVLTIELRDSILQHTDLLREIIKVAERPCDYIKDIAEVEDKSYKIWVRSYEHIGQVFYAKKRGLKGIKANIEYSKIALGCKRGGIIDYIENPSALFKRQYVLLTFFDKNIEDNIDIWVKRKDI